MTDKYTKFKIQKLDPISPTFCAAKWLMTDFKLFTGVTSSCHFPYPHKINLQSVAENLHTINNTDQKISERSLMLSGKKPPGCSNCWQVEDISDGISDRPLQSMMSDDGRDFRNLDLSADILPSIIKVSFDTFCNFVCSYCDASQSSSWASDLLVNGPYRNIKTDKENKYVRLGKKDLLPQDQYDFLRHKFSEYVDLCLPNLKSLVILGGEPLASPNFWEFYDQLSQKKVSHINLSITTNLSFLKKIQLLQKDQHKFKKIALNVSIDAKGCRAEFIRKGLVWKTFEQNLDYALDNGFDVTLISTVSLLAIDGMVEFLEWYLQKKTKYKDLGFFLCLVRWPSFQRISLLPQTIRINRAKEISQWVARNRDHLDDMTVHHISNIINMLNSDDGVEKEQEQKDTKKFFQQYSTRNNLSIENTFSKDFSDWLLS